MNNKKLMKKVIDLDTQTLKTREQSMKVMIQIAIIRKAFGVKNDETNLPVKDYERELIMSDEEITKEFNQELKWLNLSKEKNNSGDSVEYERRIHYFIEAVRFFNDKLANTFEAKFKTI